MTEEAAIGINISPKAPAGSEKHWIPSVPGMGWNGMFSLYGPLEAGFDKSWRPGDIELLKETNCALLRISDEGTGANFIEGDRPEVRQEPPRRPRRMTCYV